MALRSRTTAVSQRRAWTDLIRLYQYDPTDENPNFRRVGEPVKAPSGNLPFGVAFSPDGKRLAVGYVDVAAVDVLDGTTLERVGGHKPTDVSVSASLDLHTSRGPATARRCSRSGGTRRPRADLLFAWDRGGLGDERRMTYCGLILRHLASTPCRTDESLSRRWRLASASWTPAANRFGPSHRRSSTFAIRPTSCGCPKTAKLSTSATSDIRGSRSEI